MGSMVWAFGQTPLLLFFSLRLPLGRRHEDGLSFQTRQSLLSCCSPLPCWKDRRCCQDDEKGSGLQCSGRGWSRRTEGPSAYCPTGPRIGEHMRPFAKRKCLSSYGMVHPRTGPRVQEAGGQGALSASQEMPRATRGTLKANREAQTDAAPETTEGTNPEDTLVWEFWSPEPRHRTFLGLLVIADSQGCQYTRTPSPCITPRGLPWQKAVDGAA